MLRDGMGYGRQSTQKNRRNFKRRKGINIDNLTYGEIKQISKLFNQQQNDELLASEGKCYFIRSVTHHYTGRCVKCTPTFIELEDAAWIADDGRFHDFLKTGEAIEVETNVEDINSRRAHFSRRVRCMKCLHDVISVHPIETDPYTLECSRCGSCKSMPIPCMEIADND